MKHFFKEHSVISILFIAIVCLYITNCCKYFINNEIQNTAHLYETVNITHNQGTTEVPKYPQRIVVLDIGTLDSMDKLGIFVPEIATAKEFVPDYITGTVKQSNITDIGQLKNIDLEKISKFKPDLIIISGRQESYYDQLSKIAPTVDFSMDENYYLETFYHNLDNIGIIFDKKVEVSKAEHFISSRIKDIKEDYSAKSNKKGLFIMTTGNKIFGYGPGMRYGFLYSELGLNSVIEPTGNEDNKTPIGNILSYDFIFSKNPDYIIVCDRDYAVNMGKSAEALMDNDLIRKTNAYKNNKILYIDSATWYLYNGGITSTLRMLKDIEFVLTD